MNMKCVRILSFAVALFGVAAMSSAQTLQEVVEARNKGTELMASGDLNAAIAELERCAEMARQVGDDAEEHLVVVESALPNLYLRKANEINATRDFPATLTALKAAIEAAEKYNDPSVKERAERTVPQVYLAMGSADFQAQRFNEAIQNLNLALERDPSLTQAYFVRGASYQQLKDDPNMEESYRLAIEKGTENGDAAIVQRARTQLSNFHNQAGSAAQRAKRWDDAIAAFSKTVEIDEQNTTALYSLAACFYEKKNWDDTISNIEKAIEFRTGRENWTVDNANYFLGAAHMGKNNNAKACEHFRLVGEGTTFHARAKHFIEQTLKCR